jgi:methyl-accepting chemotaxis protein
MKNLNIGTRLALGFSIVLLLLVALTGIGVWRMHSASEITDEMIKVKVRNERMIAEWGKVIEVNAARTTTAWLAADPVDAKGGRRPDEEIVGARHRGPGHRWSIPCRPGRKGAAGAVLYAQSLHAARAQVFKEKAAGNLDAAREIYEKDMVGKRDRLPGRAGALSSISARCSTRPRRTGRGAVPERAQMIMALGCMAILLGPRLRLVHHAVDHAADQ